MAIMCVKPCLLWNKVLQDKMSIGILKLVRVGNDLKNGGTKLLTIEVC